MFFLEHIEGNTKRESCEIDCPPSQPYILANNTCVRECPSDQPIIVQSMNFLDNKQYCKAVCPEDAMYKNGNHCVSNCPDGYLLLEDVKECLKAKSCPSSFPFDLTDYGSEKACSARCPVGFLKYPSNKTCVLFLRCKTYVYESSCVDKCPPNTYAAPITSLDDEGDNPVAVDMMFHYQICRSEIVYRIWVIVCFSVVAICTPLTLCFFFYEGCRDRFLKYKVRTLRQNESLLN